MKSLLVMLLVAALQEPTAPAPQDGATPGSVKPPPMLLRRCPAFLTLVFTLTVFGGCATADPQGASRQAMLAAIQTEEAGNYWIGRRYYKVDYKFWGWLRKPGQPWSSAVLVMVNENTKLAPDREL